MSLRHFCSKLYRYETCLVCVSQTEFFHQKLEFSIFPCFGQVYYIYHPVKIKSPARLMGYKPRGEGVIVPPYLLQIYNPAVTNNERSRRSAKLFVVRLPNEHTCVLQCDSNLSLQFSAASCPPTHYCMQSLHANMMIGRQLMHASTGYYNGSMASCQIFMRIYLNVCRMWQLFNVWILMTTTLSKCYEQ